MEFGINDWRNALLDTDLPMAAKLVGVAIAKYYRADKPCFPSLLTLMDECSIKSKHTVIKAIEDLKKAGVIKVKKKELRYVSSLQNYYEFVGVDDGANNSATNGASNGATKGAINAPEIREEDNNLNITPLISPLGEKPKQTKKFVKPNLDEVIAYCQERGNKVDANRWLSYYEANGWRVGKNPMKDWRAAVRTWERDAKGESRDKNGIREIVW